MFSGGIERDHDMKWVNNRQYAHFYEYSLHEKYPYSELFWSTFYCILTEYRETLRISPYSVTMQENADQNNSEYGHFLRSVIMSMN